MTHVFPGHWHCHGPCVPYFPASWVKYCWLFAHKCHKSCTRSYTLLFFVTQQSVSTRRCTWRHMSHVFATLKLTSTTHADTMQTLLRCTPSRVRWLWLSWLAYVVRAGCFFWPRLHIRAFPSYFPRRAPCSHGTTSCPSRLFDRLHLFARANQPRRVDTRSGGLRGCRPPYRGRRTRHGR